jgi:MFS family permease
MVTVPLMAAAVFGKSPLEGGLQLLRMTIAIGVGALIGGYVTQRFGSRIPAITGLLVTTLGFLLLSSWTMDIAEPMLTIHLAIAGLGLGLLISPIAETALWGVQGDQRGAASALLSVSRMVGMTVGLATMTALGTVQFHNLVAEVPAFSTDPVVQQQIIDSASDAAVEVFTRLYTYAAVLSAVALVPAWLMTRSRGSA